MVKKDKVSTLISQLKIPLTSILLLEQIRVCWIIGRKELQGIRVPQAKTYDFIDLCGKSSV